MTNENEEREIQEADIYPELETEEVYQYKSTMFAEMWSWTEDIVNRTNVLKGWTRKERRDGEIICLIHSELSEAVEALREGNHASKVIPQVSSAEEEIADTIIRIMDLCKTKNWNLPKALFLKMEYNKTRPYRHGGKLF